MAQTAAAEATCPQLEALSADWNAQRPQLQLMNKPSDTRRNRTAFPASKCRMLS